MSQCFQKVECFTKNILYRRYIFILNVAGECFRETKYAAVVVTD